MAFKLHTASIPDLLNESHSKSQVNQIIFAVDGDQEQFNKLMKIFLGKDEELARRAAWAMGYIVIKHPSLINKWYPKIINKLSQENQHPAIYRNTFRFLEVIQIPEKHAAGILDTAYSFILNRSHPVAIRAFALSTAMNVVRNHPELGSELKAVVNQIIQEKSPAIRSRSKKVLSQLDRM